jgi:hypothetical protein
MMPEGILKLPANPPGRCHFDSCGRRDRHDESKGTAIPLQALTGPEGFRRLRLPDFKTIVT